MNQAYGSIILVIVLSARNFDIKTEIALRKLSLNSLSLSLFLLLSKFYLLLNILERTLIQT